MKNMNPIGWLNVSVWGRITALALLSLPLFGCGSNPSSLTADSLKVVTVNFDDNKCPVSTSFEGQLEGVPLLQADVDHIRWISNPEDIKFEVFFEPFRGQPIKSNAKGVTNKKKTMKADDLPLTDYKYIIWNKNDCADAPLDPNFRVFK
jgi:hypothetical protein